MIAVDLETTLISEEEPIPTMVCYGAYDGQEATVSVKMADLVALLNQALLNQTKLVFHNSAFDLLVIYQVATAKTKALIQTLVEQDLITDTYIREMLYNLSTQGRITKGYSLAKLSEKYLSRERTDKEDGWRLRYSELQDRSLSSWPQEAVDYVKQDVIDTFEIWQEQELIRKPFGPGSMNTETLQIAANLALGWSTARGIEVDQPRLQTMFTELSTQANSLSNQLIEYGFGEYDKKGVFKRSTKIFREYIASIITPTYTDKGNIKIDKNELKKLNDKRVTAWDKYSSLQKMLTSYLPKLMGSQGTIRPVYDILKETGRTSSRASSVYPGLNIQNMPRLPGLRECLIPRKGKSFVSVDYSNLELCSTAQVLYDIYKESSMMDAINEGDEPVDLHAKLGHKLAELDNNSHDFKYYRTMAKPINLGYPGGIGAKKVAQISKDQYEIDISVDEARKMKKLFLLEYPQLKRFLNEYSYRHLLHSGEFFYEVNGRYRNNCGYSAFCNGRAMQSLAADGAKVAAWELFKADLPFVAFIHDEFIFEFDNDDNSKMELAMEIMVDAMKSVMPDVRITVEANVMDKCWTKDGPFKLTQTYWSDLIKKEVVHD